MPDEYQTSENLGPDLAFDARMRKQSELRGDADKRLREAHGAIEKAGGLTPEVVEYAEASSEVARLTIHRDWLLAAEGTLSPSQREAIATVQGDIANSRTSEQSLQQSGKASGIKLHKNG